MFKPSLNLTLFENVEECVSGLLERDNNVITTTSQLAQLRNATTTTQCKVFQSHSPH